MAQNGGRRQLHRDFSSGRSVGLPPRFAKKNPWLFLWDKGILDTEIREQPSSGHSCVHHFFVMFWLAGRIRRGGGGQDSDSIFRHIAIATTALFGIPIPFLIQNVWSFLTTGPAPESIRSLKK
jgi:hypothetical protein